MEEGTEQDCLVPSHENGNAPTGCRPLKKYNNAIYCFYLRFDAV